MKRRGHFHLPARPHISRRTSVLALIVAVVPALAGGVAYASIPDANGVIHGCYQNTRACCA
jgi:hypothetical protein